MSTSSRQQWAIAAAVAFSSVPVTVVAQPPAVAAKALNLRAGPGRDYPLVLQVGAGTPLAVQGCIDGYSWCDVIVPGNNRGWVYAGNIAYPYQDNRVPLLQYGAVIGLPIIGFTIGSYWGDYYRNRPFYRDRGRWENRPLPHRPGFAGPPPGQGRPGFAGRPPADGHFQGGGGRPPDGVRPGGGGQPPFGRGNDRGGRPDRAGPASGRPDRGGPDGGRPGVGQGRPDGPGVGGRGGAGDTSAGPSGGEHRGGGRSDGDHGGRPGR